jgi:hypothetical protein
MGEDNRQQRLLIKALILVWARLDLMYQRQANQDPLELIRAAMFAGHTKEKVNDHDHTTGLPDDRRPTRLTSNRRAGRSQPR